MTNFRRRIAAASLLWVVTLALAHAPTAHAYGPHRDCGRIVRAVHIAGRLHTRFPGVVRPQTIYFAGPLDRLWVYLETNQRAGLQRNDNQCSNPGSSHDTVLTSTRIICTCDYPFGDYPPESVIWWLLRQVPV